MWACPHHPSWAPPSSGGLRPPPSPGGRREGDAAKLIEVNSKAQSRNLTHSIDLTHFRDDLRRRGAIDRNKRDRRASLFVTPKRESGNIDARVAEEPLEAADEAGLVIVVAINHQRSELRVDLDPLDRKDARFAVMKDGPANRPRLLRRLDGQRDEALIIAVRRAGHFLDDDAP